MSEITKIVISGKRGTCPTDYSRENEMIVDGERIIRDLTDYDRYKYIETALWYKRKFEEDPTIRGVRRHGATLQEVGSYLLWVENRKILNEMLDNIYILEEGKEEKEGM